jgi:thioredoxin-like negative regulator of GroEL
MAHYLLGLMLHDEKGFAEAEPCFREALRLKPDYMDAIYGLGTALQQLGRLNEARDCYLRALQLRPDDLTARYNLGTLHQAEGRYAEAESEYRVVLHAAPDHRDSLMGLAGIAQLRGALDDARGYFEQVLRQNPDDPEARFGLSLILLVRGQWAEGWEQHEARFRCSHIPRHDFAQPRWNGEATQQGTILVHAECGLGDAIQFVRYVPLVRGRAPGAQVILNVQRELMPLLAGSGLGPLVPRGGALPAFDVHVPLMSLARIFETRVESTLANVPYLKSDPGRVGQWRARLAELDGFKVGIHWQGNPGFAVDRHRSMGLACFEPLARVSGVRLISLQKGTGSQQVTAMRERFAVIELAQLDEQGGAFMDTAAVIENLDLVITSDSAVAHLAGALARPVWLALSAVGEWRWLLERADSPWYPTMRLFRQAQLDQWDEVFQRIAEALRETVAAKYPGGQP